MTKPVILTGLRANNDLTLGNYFGGMLPIIEMAKQQSEEFQINMFIPDLHSFTTPIDHSQLYEQILNNARLFAAAGLPLDNDNIHLYRQSYVSAHSELTWILDNFTSFGQLERMTQFKEKSGLGNITAEYSRLIPMAIEEYGEEVVSKVFSENADLTKPDSKVLLMISEQMKKLVEEIRSKSSVGLFNYPVLMAADILLYQAQYIPVGDDQTQHLEFARDIAERMNKKFGDLFVIPEPVQKQHKFFGKGQGLRIKDLVDPSKKMSKSEATGRGVIFLTDNPDVAAKKIMSATTDDKANVKLDSENQPGISNLLQILTLLRGSSLEDTAHEFEGMQRYGDFKKIVASELKAFLIDFQTKLSQVDNDAINAKLQSSEVEMNKQANETLYRVQQAVGLRPKASNG